MAAIIAQKGVIGLQVESTNGTEAAADGSDAVLVYDFEINTLAGAESLTRHPITPSFSMQTPIPGMQSGECSFTLWLGGSGATGPTTPPPWDVPFRACSWNVAATPSPVTTHTYTPSSAGAGGFDTAAANEGKTHTLYAWIDGVLYKLIGATGNAKLILEVGQAIKAECTMQGAYAAPTSTAVVTPTYGAASVPPICTGAAVTYTPSGGSAHTSVLRSIEIDTVYDTILRKDMNSTPGVIAAQNTNREPTFTLVVEQPAGAANSTTDLIWHTQFTAGTVAAISIGPIGSTTGNKIDIDMPNVGLTKVEEGEEDGIRILTITGTAAANALATGNDEISIAVT